MGTLPWGDWQFYAVTAATLWGFWTVARQLIPRPSAAGGPCGACASGAAACAKPAARKPAADPQLVTLGGGRRAAGRPPRASGGSS